MTLVTIIRAFWAGAWRVVGAPPTNPVYPDTTLFPDTTVYPGG